ncbi:MAG: aspartate-semialdehyde dehydrogenase [Bacteroidales bacterium]|nr:aspartate-semialdehyde dehydrogenase [Bacteroidales bacterium]
MKIAVVGATGLVGGVMLQELAQRGFADAEIIPAASAKSVGRTISFAGRNLTVVSVDEAIALRPQYAVFSAGASTSRMYAPRFAEVGCTVIDNSSCWRMHDDVPLVVPEININAVSPDCRIIANPNCSTIQMVLAVSRLHWQYKIKRLVISTYQSITGTGIKAVRQLEAEEAYFAAHNDVPSSQLGSAIQESGVDYQPAYPNQIFRNLFPHGGDFLPDGYTTEEQKLVDETRKILADPSIQVSATVVRVPVVGGHSEAVNIEFHNEYDLQQARQLIADTPGVILLDDPSANQYPMPILSHNRPEVFVGRVRRDATQPCTLNLWCVADNLRKGAATNAVQILQELVKRR